VQKQTLGAVEN